MATKNQLTAIECDNAAPRESRYALSDGNGLFLNVYPSGTKTWKARLRVGGKLQEHTLGPFPEVSVKDARLILANLRLKIAHGINPAEEKQAARNEASGKNGFEALAMDWFHAVHATQVVPAHADRNLSRLNKLVLPYLGKHRPEDITPPMVLEVLRRIAARGHVETAHRVKSILSLIFRYGISLGRLERDPTRDLTGILPAAEVVHHPAILDVSELAGLLRALDGYQGTPIVTAAARLLPLIFCRPGEMLNMCWPDIDPAKTQWVWVSAKTRTQMITPLSRQAMQILAGLKPLTGEGRFVLPSLRAKDKPLSNTAIKGALDSLGYRGRMTSHGWRAVARTHLVETMNYPVDIVEMQLGHSVRDALGRAYNRTTFLDPRREMMQAWADWLDEVRLLPAPASASPVDGVDPWAQWTAD
ncbi:tyrosine-type recombinase/integrase [Desulfobotulus mexicanus]|uniref:DUF4102 domain-containing protein n=1 Tax=Desulfobotulus mexicanus TaxID=2586642 RepID=A0A5S5MC80_9BACT|nr:integrase arm-type DNA-binding domain-containing protein [Desulfobotulus mexicanus]TYT73336.1 DUF4102 domain-containing protein [Desulfobotulus mexicanus]